MNASDMRERFDLRQSANAQAARRSRRDGDCLIYLDHNGTMFVRTVMEGAPLYARCIAKWSKGEEVYTA